MKKRSSLSLLFLLVVVLWAAACHSPATQDEKNESKVATAKTEGQFEHGNKPRDFDYPTGGVELGQGWTSNDGRKVNSKCIDFSVKQDSAQEKSFDGKLIVDKSSLMTQLDVSAESRVQGVVGSGGAKVHFVSSVQVDQEQSNFSVHAQVRNGANYVTPQTNGTVDLSPRYRKLAHKDLAEFRRQCGDSYVSTIFGGAELSAVLTFHVYKLDEKKSISASVEGSGLGGVVSANGSANQTMHKYSESSQFTVSYYEAGGSGDPIPANQEGLIKVIESLPQLAASAPKNFTIRAERYDRLPSWPDKKSDWLYTRYEDIASQYEKLSSLYDSVEIMIQNPNDYVLGRGVSQENLRAMAVKLLDHMKNLKMKAKACLDSSGADCVIENADAISDYEYRVLLPVRYVACQGCIDLDAANQARDRAQKIWADRIAFWRAFAEEKRIDEKQKFWGNMTQGEYAAYMQAKANADIGSRPNIQRRFDQRYHRSG